MERPVLPSTKTPWFRYPEDLDPVLRDIRDNLDVLDSDVDDIQSGALPIALPGIEGALGERNASMGVVNAADLSPTEGNWHPVLQDAADELSENGGGTIELPPGRAYRLDDTLVLPLNPTVNLVAVGPRAGLEQQADPWAATLRTGTSGMTLISVGDGESLYHRGPSIVGVTLENYAGGNATLVEVDAVNRMLFRDVVFRGYSTVIGGSATDHALVMGWDGDAMPGGDCAFHMLDNCSWFGFGGDALNWYGQGVILGGQFACPEGGYAMRLRGGNTRVLGPKVDNGLMEFNVQASTLIVHSEYHFASHPPIVTIGSDLSDHFGWPCRANTFRGSVRGEGELAFALGQHAHQNEITAFIENCDSPAYSEHGSASGNTITLYDSVPGYPIT